jgi:hypothetical protein
MSPRSGRVCNSRRVQVIGEGISLRSASYARQVRRRRTRCRAPFLLVLFFRASKEKNDLFSHKKIQPRMGRGSAFAKIETSTFAETKAKAEKTADR